jgi:small subunit ribosomal protein S3
MGQKTHPLGFRLGITQEHTTWYANFNQYANVLQEDDKNLYKYYHKRRTVFQNKPKR